jgi:hypothetical protein
MLHGASVSEPQWWPDTNAEARTSIASGPASSSGAMIAAAAKDCYAGLDPASDVVPNLRVETL